MSDHYEAILYSADQMSKGAVARLSKNN